MVDLEHATSRDREVTEVAKARGLLKKLKNYTTLRLLLLLSDVLPRLSELSLVFQKTKMNLGEVKPHWNQTCRQLEDLRPPDSGLHSKSAHALAGHSFGAAEGEIPR